MSGLAVPKHTNPRGYNQPRKVKCQTCSDEAYLIEHETDRGIYESIEPCPDCGSPRYF